MRLSVRACVRMFVRVCVRACLRAWLHVYTCARACENLARGIQALILAHPMWRHASEGLGARTPLVDLLIVRQAGHEVEPLIVAHACVCVCVCVCVYVCVCV